MRLLCVFLLALLALPAAEPIYETKNLVAWCIVPFDNQKRTPEQRAAMVAKMGLTKVAYDWRQEHVANVSSPSSQRIISRSHLQITPSMSSQSLLACEMSPTPRER